VLLGCTVVLWFGGLVSGRATIITVVACGAALVGTHTRTALLGLGIGLAVAGASMFLGHARVRRTTAMIAVIGVFGATLFTPVITTWLYRGQSIQEASQLTGRTKVWSAIAELQRPRIEELFGSGLSNKSFNGLPIDSNWLAVAIDVALLLTIILLAITHQRGVRRAIALFLVAYCIAASVTETGLGDASPYLLELVVAASLLAAPAREARL
jgi:O-antigen ligase